MFDDKRHEIIRNTVRSMVHRMELNKKFRIMDDEDWINEVYIHFLRYPVDDNYRFTKPLIYNALTKIIDRYSRMRRHARTSQIPFSLDRKITKKLDVDESEDLYVRVADSRYSPEAVMYSDPEFILSFVKDEHKPFLAAYITGKENQMVFLKSRGCYVSKTTKRNLLKKIIEGLRESLGTP